MNQKEIKVQQQFVAGFITADLIVFTKVLWIEFNEACKWFNRGLIEAN